MLHIMDQKLKGVFGLCAVPITEVKLTSPKSYINFFLIDRRRRRGYFRKSVVN